MTKQTGMAPVAYREAEGLSWSALKHIYPSPAHFMEYKNAPPKQTEDLLMGSALHALVLEGEDAFAARYAVAPDVNKRTNAGKAELAAFMEANPGKELLSAEQVATIRAMAAAIEAHPKAARLLAKCGERELSIFWEDPTTGVACKGRLDGCDPDGGLVLDLKTAVDASPKGFGQAAAKFGYHGQAAFYLKGLAEEGRTDAAFVFLAIEKAPPFAVGLYHIDGEELEAGRTMVEQYLDTYARCEAAGEWPGYSPDVEPLNMPKWAI